MPRYWEILDIAKSTIATLKEIGVEDCCFIGGMACKLYSLGEGRQPGVRTVEKRAYGVRMLTGCFIVCFRTLTSFASPLTRGVRSPSSSGFVSKTATSSLSERRTPGIGGRSCTGTPAATNPVSRVSRSTSSYRGLWTFPTSTRTT